MKVKAKGTWKIDVAIDPHLKQFLKKIYVWNRYKANIKAYVREEADENEYLESVTGSFQFTQTPEGFDFWQLVDWLWEDHHKNLVRDIMQEEKKFLESFNNFVEGKTII